MSAYKFRLEDKAIINKDFPSGSELNKGDAVIIADRDGLMVGKKWYSVSLVSDNGEGEFYDVQEEDLEPRIKTAEEILDSYNKTHLDLSHLPDLKQFMLEVMEEYAEQFKQKQL